MTLENKPTKKKIIIVLCLSALLGITSLLFNLQTVDELSTEEAPLSLALRLAISYILNGAPWGILLIISGMAGENCRQAILLSIAAALLALSVHYGLGIGLGFFEELGDNALWFIRAIPMGIILGLVGYFSKGKNLLGNLLKMTIPLSLIIEPFSLHRFTSYWYNRPVVDLANKIAGWLELIIGIVIFILFLFNIRKNEKSKIK